MKKMRKNLAMCMMTVLMAATVFFSGATTVRAEENTTDTQSTENQSSTDNQSSQTQTDTTVTGQTATPAGSTGSAYVCLGDTFQTPSAKAGQQVTLVLPIVNYCHCPITNVVITPRTSNLVSVWPFELSTTGFSKSVPYISAYTDGADVNQTRADVTYNFTVRKDVMTGYYPLNFDITYLENGEAQSTTTVTAYIQTTGSTGSGYLDENGGTSTPSKPRIIVTGFETDPEKVCAGDTFTLTVHVKNTSPSTAVSNVLFNLQAAQETSGTSSTTGTTGSTYAAFLPTSGSSSIYENGIGAGETKDLQIEMSARADLTQKPYVLDVNMTYDSAKSTDITDKVSVSIPIYQESRFDTGEEEIMPQDIYVGDQSNVSFSLYNTGKTTLYNVWVKYTDEAVEAEDVYVGTITSGATGYVDSSVTAIAANSGTVKMEISYEDEAGDTTTVEKEVNLSIMEMDTEYMDAMMEDMPMEEDMTGTASGSSVKYFVIAGIVILAVIILVLVLKHRKKKKLKNEEDDDLLALDELEDNDKNQME